MISYLRFAHRKSQIERQSNKRSSKKCKKYNKRDRKISQLNFLANQVLNKKNQITRKMRNSFKLKLDQYNILYNMISLLLYNAKHVPSSLKAPKHYIVPQLNSASIYNPYVFAFSKYTVDPCLNNKIPFLTLYVAGNRQKSPLLAVNLIS